MHSLPVHTVHHVALLALLLRAHSADGSAAGRLAGLADAAGRLAAGGQRVLGSLGLEQEELPAATNYLTRFEVAPPLPEEEAAPAPPLDGERGPPGLPLGHAEELRAGYESLQTGVRRSAQVLQESIRAQQEAARALAGDARVRREHAQAALRHDELQLQEALARREHEALLEENAQLQRELTQAPAGLGRNALYAIVLAAVLVLGSCAFWSLRFFAGAPKEPEEHDEDAKLFSKAYKRRNINGVSHTYAQNVALLATFVVGGFVALCWMGVVQSMMRQVAALGFLTLALLGLLYVFLHEFWSEFAEQHKDIMKLVKKVSGLFEGGMSDVRDNAVSFFRTPGRRK